MNGWSGLSKELLDIIFRNLGKKDLQQCSLVCQDWKVLAQNVLFDTISLRTDTDLENMLDALFVLKNNNTLSPGSFVKTLNSTFLKNHGLLKSIDIAFPNLEFFNIKHHTIFNHELFEQELYRLIDNGSFPNLKTIPNLWTSESYQNLVLSRKEKLKEIYSRDTPSPTAGYDQLQKNLQLFPKLRVLRIERSYDTAPRYIEGYLLRIPSSLEEIYFHFTIPATLTVDDPLVGVDDVKPLLNLKKVGIECSRFLSDGDEVFEYLMKTFPLIDNLDIPFTQYYVLENFTLPTVDCIATFLVYLFNRRGDTRVGPIITDKDTDEVMERFLKYISTEGSITYTNVEIELQVIYQNVWTEGLPPPYSFIEAHSFMNGPRKKCFVKVYYMFRMIDGEPFINYISLLERIKDKDIDLLTIGDDDESLYVGHGASLSLDTQFTMVKRLKISRFSDFDFSTSEQEWTLIGLELDRCELTTANLRALTKKLPTLKTLHFNNVQMDVGFLRQLYPVRMAYTRVENLIWSSDIPSDGDAAFRLSTRGKKPRYCRITMEDFDDDFKVENYEACVNNSECRIIELYFEQVKSFTVELFIKRNDIKIGTLERVFPEEDL